MTDTETTQQPNRCIASDRVEGTRVYNKQGEKLGTIRHFMVDKRSGQAQYAVMEFGGILGMGSESYPLPWNMLDYDEKQGGYVVDIDKDKLVGAPTHTTHTIWDDIYGQRIYSYYGFPYPYF